MATLPSWPQAQPVLDRCGLEPTAGYPPYQGMGGDLSDGNERSLRGFFAIRNKTVHSNLGLKLNSIPSSQLVSSTPPGMHKNDLAYI